MHISKKCLVILSCFTLSLFIISCDDNAELRDEYNALFTKVIAVHDELMPKMTELSQLQEQLKREDSTTLKNDKKEALNSLKESDERMMIWMHDFTDEYVKNRIPVAKMTVAELQKAIKGLKAELHEVESLRDYTHTSIEAARQVLK